MSSAVPSSSNDSRSMTWHQWQAEYPMERRMGRSSLSAAGERFVAPCIPVHRVCGVLEQIGAGFERERGCVRAGRSPAMGGRTDRVGQGVCRSCLVDAEGGSEDALRPGCAADVSVSGDRSSVRVCTRMGERHARRPMAHLESPDPGVLQTLARFAILAPVPHPLVEPVGS